MALRGSGWLGAVSALAVALGATAAFAQSSARMGDGMYITGGAGISFPRDSSLEGGGVDLDADLDTGWAALIGVGQSYSNNFRSEFEISHRDNNVGSIGGADANGNMSAWAAMANIYYDVPTGWALRPFVGVGLGVARVAADGAAPFLGSRVDDSDTAFAWQATAGVAYALSERMDATVAYRYWSAPDLEFEADNGTSVDSDYATHSVMFGLRYALGAPARPAPQPAMAPAPQPAPAPPPAAAPAPPPAPPMARNYIVFFDWNSAAITDQARGIIRTAAENAKKASPVRIRATGHADRSGPEGYNMRLSMRRANALKAEMVRQGIPADQIAVVARGEAEPLVATADGVREPQNRRVEIVIE